MSLVPAIYRSSDTSAPALSALTGALVTILDAVLVNGYGSQPGLGWTIEDSGTNWRVYRHNPITGTGMYLHVDDSGSGAGAGREAIVRGYQQWDDVTHTGTLPFPTSAQLAGGIVWKKSATSDATARPWMVIGNERCIYLFTDGNSGKRQVFFAGDITPFKSGDARHYLVSGGLTQDVSMGVNISTTLLVGIPVYNFNLGLTNGYFAGNAASSANSVVAKDQDAPQFTSALSGYCFGTSQHVNRPYPGVVSGGLDVARIHLFENMHAERGFWPGLYQPLHSFPFSDMAQLPGAGPGNVDVLAVSYRRAYSGNVPNDDGQLIFELGVEW